MGCRTSLLLCRERTLLTRFFLRLPLLQERLWNENIALGRDTSASGQQMPKLDAAYA